MHFLVRSKFSPRSNASVKIEGIQIRLIMKVFSLLYDGITPPKFFEEISTTLRNIAFQSLAPQHENDQSTSGRSDRFLTYPQQLYLTYL